MDFRNSGPGICKIAFRPVIGTSYPERREYQSRCLSETQPVPNAVHTSPLLEDSYLWLLRNVKLANHENIITQ